MDAALAENPWLAGDAYSLADIGYTPYFVRMEQLGLGDVIFGEHVRNWGERLRARSSYSAAIDRWLNPKYLALFAEKRADATARVRSLLA
jgi:glutathione S-transferase